MSPARRSSGEVHILAMLDGRAGGRRKRGRTTLRWYGAGAMLACTLLAALAWLVRGAPVRDASPAVVAAALPAAQAAPAIPTTPAPQTPRTHTAPPDADAAPNARGMPEADAAPAPTSAPAMRGAHIVDLAPSARAAPAPEPRIAALVAPARPQPAYRRVPHVAPSPPGAQSAPRSSSLARADAPPAHRKRGAAAVRAPSAPPATVDTDVAVISAILQHAAGGPETADVNSAAACSDKPCGPRMPSR